jgi:predicted HicB family RNase H-like nuclease
VAASRFAPGQGSPGRGALLSVDPSSREPAGERLTLRLTARQLGQLKARAEASGLSLAEYARLVLLEEEGRVVLALEDRERAAFEEAAKRAGYSLGYYLRSLLPPAPSPATRGRRR